LYAARFQAHTIFWFRRSGLPFLPHANWLLSMLSHGCSAGVSYSTVLRPKQHCLLAHHCPPISTLAFGSLTWIWGLICFLDGFRKNPLSLDRCERLLSWGAGYGMVWVQGAQRPRSGVGLVMVWHGTGSTATMQRSGLGEGTECRWRGLGEEWRREEEDS
jgi:hypothetical protein